MRPSAAGAAQSLLPHLGLSHVRLGAGPDLVRYINIQTNCRQLLGRIVLDPNLSAVIEYILLVFCFSKRQDWTDHFLISGVTGVDKKIIKFIRPAKGPDFVATLPIFSLCPDCPDQNINCPDIGSI